MSLLLGGILLTGSVLLGAGMVVLLHKVSQEKIIKFLLSLSGGFLLAIAFVHFIPEIYEHNSGKVGYYILLGFLIQLFLEYFSGGIEHGHIHGKNMGGAMPWSLFIALSLHALFEAVPLSSTFFGDITEPIVELGHHHHHTYSSSLLIGIVLHKVPVAIALMTMLLASGFKIKKAWIVLIAFSLMSPIGMVLGHYTAKGMGLNLELVLAVVVGMFLHISTTIVFESNENHQFNFLKLFSILAGVLLAIVTL